MIKPRLLLIKWKIWNINDKINLVLDDSNTISML